jgi:replicative DNA helicase
LFLYRPEVYETNPSPEILGMAEVIIAKHRSGPTGSVQLSWLEQYARFDNLGKGI